MNKQAIWDKYFGTEVSRQVALDAYNSDFWKDGAWEPVELAYLQFNQKRLIMPFDVWWQSVDKTLGRPTLNTFPIVPEVEEGIKSSYFNFILLGQTETQS